MEKSVGTKWCTHFFIETVGPIEMSVGEECELYCEKFDVFCFTLIWIILQHARANVYESEDANHHSIIL